ncbi:MAG: hypothetical protein R3F20_10735 [Planctomycetota bacterium]
MAAFTFFGALVMLAKNRYPIAALLGALTLGLCVAAGFRQRRWNEYRNAREQFVQRRRAASKVSSAANATEDEDEAVGPAEARAMTRLRLVPCGSCATPLAEDLLTTTCPVCDDTPEGNGTPTSPVDPATAEALAALDRDYLATLEARHPVAPDGRRDLPRVRDARIVLAGGTALGAAVGGLGLLRADGAGLFGAGVLLFVLGVWQGRRLRGEARRHETAREAYHAARRALLGRRDPA